MSYMLLSRKLEAVPKTVFSDPLIFTVLVILSRCSLWQVAYRKKLQRILSPKEFRDSFVASQISNSAYLALNGRTPGSHNHPSEGPSTNSDNDSYHILALMTLFSSTIPRL